SIRRKIDRPTVVLPQPLSPTSPNVSPSRTNRETSSTALTSAIFRRKIPPWTGKYLLKPLTSSKTSVSADALSGLGIVSHLRIVKPATGVVVGVRLDHRRRLVADRHPLRTTVCETAPFGHKPRIGHDACNRRQALLLGGTQHGDGVH